MNIIAERNYDDVKSSMLDRFDEVRTFKGMFNCYTCSSSNFLVTYPGDNEKTDTIISPVFEYFKEESLKNSSSVFKTSSNIYNCGRYKTGTVRDIYLDDNPIAMTAMNLLLSQYRIELDTKYGTQINKPNILFFDLETGSEKGKPVDFMKFPIISLGYAVNDRKKYIYDIQHELRQEGIEIRDLKDLNNNEDILRKEKELLLFFFDLVEKANIDIIVGYNSGTFDLPYILFRARRVHKIPLNVVCKIFRFSDSFGTDEKEILLTASKKINLIIRNAFDGVRSSTMNLFGRVHIDLYHLWHKQSKLKDVCVKLGIIASKLDVDASNMWYEYINNYDEFIRYLFLDIDLARELFLIDFPRISNLLESLNCGLSFLATKSSTTEATQMFCNTLLRNNIFSPHTCTETNPIFLLMPTAYYNKNKRTKYAGAIVGVEQIGRFKNCTKYDVASYYPNTIVSFQLGLTNTQVSGILPYTGKYSFVDKGSFCYIVIPDHNLKYNLVLKRFNFKCPVIQDVIDGFINRLKYKELAKEYKSKDKTKYYLYDSISNSLKVVINGMYGCYLRLNGISNPASGILTTGLGRYCLTMFMNVIKEYTKKSGKEFNPIIEIDTDGIYMAYQYNLEQCNALMTNIVKTTGCAFDTTIEFDDEKFKNIFIKSAKNYIYQEDGDVKFKLKGSSINSKKHTALESKARDIFIEKYINNKESFEDVIFYIDDQFENLFDVNDFIVPKTNIKSIESYSLTSLERKLGNQYSENYGIRPDLNSKLDYIYVDASSPHILATDKNIEEIKHKKLKIDKSYYLKRIKTMIRKEL